MDSACKYYHSHELDPVHFLDLYFSSKTEFQEEAVINPMTFLHTEKVAGRINGKGLAYLSVGPTLHLLFSICDCFKEITILEFNDSCISELEKWRNSHEEAYDWSHASKVLMDLEGKSIVWQQKEELLRGKIKQVLKCDITKDNLTDPIVLSKADCILCAWTLDAISPDKDAYICNFRKVSSLLKPGGRLILFGTINHSFYYIGEHKYNVVVYDEEFLGRTLKKEGYTIESYKAYDRKSVSHLVDNEKYVFINAVKQKKH